VDEDRKMYLQVGLELLSPVVIIIIIIIIIIVVVVVVVTIPISFVTRVPMWTDRDSMEQSFLSKETWCSKSIETKKKKNTSNSEVCKFVVRVITESRVNVAVENSVVAFY